MAEADTTARRVNVSLAAALEEARERYVAANPKSRARHAAAKAVMPGGNTRSVLHYDPVPVAFVEGRGARLRDADGHDYVDFLGEDTAGLYGHSNPAIAAAGPTWSITRPPREGTSGLPIKRFLTGLSIQTSTTGTTRTPGLVTK